MKLEESENLNLYNLNTTKIPLNNYINKYNIIFELNNKNSSYLLNFSNQKYLINKINNSIVLTNLNNKQSQLIKNNELFKLDQFDYILYKESTLLIPLINKKIFDNNYGISFNNYIPRTS